MFKKLDAKNTETRTVRASKEITRILQEKFPVSIRLFFYSAEQGL